jgi:LPXTG-site transpeptidase (sortase) family protein
VKTSPDKPIGSGRSLAALLVLLALSFLLFPKAHDSAPQSAAPRMNEGVVKQGGRRRRRGRLLVSTVLMLAGLLVVTGSLYVYLATDGSAGTEPSAVVPEAATYASPTPEPATLAPTPPAVPSPEPFVPISRLRIPRLGVDAEVVVLGIDASGAMVDPSTPTAVAWYDFSSRPGSQGNAVFAGHVDYANYGPAVFFNLANLRAEDEIAVGLADGTVLRYAVVSKETYTAAAAPVQEIVGPTDNEMVTLITCGGRFDTRSREYDQRVVVRARRVL